MFIFCLVALVGVYPCPCSLWWIEMLHQEATMEYNSSIISSKYNWRIYTEKNTRHKPKYGSYSLYSLSTHSLNQELTDIQSWKGLHFFEQMVSYQFTLHL